MSDGQAELAALVREWIELVTMRAMRAWWHFVRASELSTPQLGVLMMLYHDGSCGVRDVSRRMDFSSAAASQLIQRLVQAGLVGRTEDPADRRARLISLSPHGRALVEQGLAERYRWVDRLATTLDGERLQTLLEALPILIDAERALHSDASES